MKSHYFSKLLICLAWTFMIFSLVGKQCPGSSCKNCEQVDCTNPHFIPLCCNQVHHTKNHQKKRPNADNIDNINVSPEELSPNCDSASGTLFLPRPQYLYSSVFINPFYYDQPCPPCFSLDLGYRYLQTRKSNRIADCLLGGDTLFFSGSKACNRQENDLLADNFGFSPNFRGRLSIDPSIKNHIFDLGARWELGYYASCLDCCYFALAASIVHTEWDLHGCTENEEPCPLSFSSFNSCYQAQENSSATNNIRTALAGEFLFGDMQDSWRFGKIIFDRSDHDTKLANIDIILGCDIFRCPLYHTGIFLKAVTPTGTSPHGRRFFEAIIGNGHHWELGGGIDGHWDFWICNEQALSLWVRGSATHLFKDTQWRSFDFRESTAGTSGFLSRYTLLKEFDQEGNYAGHLHNAINFTTQRIKSSFAVQGDAAIELIYRYCSFAFGAGYNVYGRSREKIELHQSCTELNTQRLGIKGITGVCAKEFIINSGLTGATTPLSATESEARIFNVPELPNLVDNSVLLIDQQSNQAFITWDSPDAPNTPESELIIAQDSEINETPAPVLVSLNNLAIRPIPPQLSHSFFAHINYQWSDCCWQPYLSVGGQIEFAQNSDCRVCTPNTWSIWVRAGLFY